MGSLTILFKVTFVGKFHSIIWMESYGLSSKWNKLPTWLGSQSFLLIGWFHAWLLQTIRQIFSPSKLVVLKISIVLITISANSKSYVWHLRDVTFRMKCSSLFRHSSFKSQSCPHFHLAFLSRTAKSESRKDHIICTIPKSNYRISVIIWNSSSRFNGESTLSTPQCLKPSNSQILISWICLAVFVFLIVLLGRFIGLFVTDHNGSAGANIYVSYFARKER